ncbi:MAG: hypothetical protein EXR72_03285 [Myxococcales bacterium]|nr:hypothetical protein [Myxococcales bacterium]
MDRWLEEGKVQLVGEVMSLPALGRSFRLKPAVHFTRIVSDEIDHHMLVGRVKTREQLAALGAECYASSVLLGESAYECEPGFVGEVTGSALIGAGIQRLE